MSVVRISRRKRLLGYMVLQPVASCQMGYPAAHTSSDEEVGHAQGPLMIVPMDPLWPAEKASRDYVNAKLSHLSVFT